MPDKVTLNARILKLNDLAVKERRLFDQLCRRECRPGVLVREIFGETGGLFGCVSWVSAGGFVTGLSGKLSPASRAARRTARCQFSRRSGELVADAAVSACSIRRSAALSITTARRTMTGSDTCWSLMARSSGPAPPVDARLLRKGE